MGGGIVVEALGLDTRHRAAGESLQGAERVLILAHDKTDGVPDSLGASRAPDAVDIVLMVRREVVIDDMRDAIDIDSPGGDIGGDKDADFPVPEIVQRTEPLVLGTVGVDGGRGDSRGFEPLGDAIGAMFRSGEDQHHGEMIVLKEVEKQGRLQR